MTTASEESAKLSMQNAIIKYIDSKIPKNNNQAQIGTISGGYVRSTDGRTYRAEPTVNIYYGDGSKVVYAVAGNTAAVLGVV